MSDTADSPIPASPYKGLMPFGDSELDAMLFFGREREREIIAANLAASRLTILYGESGVGKTSVLRAGVAYHLRQLARQNLADRDAPELAVVVFDTWHGDPVAALAAATAEQAGDLVGSQVEPPEPNGSLADVLARWSVLTGDLYVILDQIEEYFVYHPQEEDGESFGAELAEAITRSDLRVNFVISLREDALAKLDRFKGRVPNLFANYLRLDHLQRDAARMAILEPLEQYNRMAANVGQATIEPELVEAVLDEISAGGVELRDAVPVGLADSAGTPRIETPFLQLVMQRLWEESGDGSSPRALRMETFRALGGAKQIVEEHLGRALDALDEEEKKLAASIFNHLVTPTGGKIAHTVADLAEYARAPEDRLAPVLSTLAGERILRPVAAADEPEGSRFEIFHDVLASPVLSWRTGHEAQRELEEERSGAARRHRRLLAVAVASLLGLAVAVGLAVFALTQRSEARSQAAIAQSRELAASALTQLAADPELGLLLAREAARVEPTPQAERALRDALIASRVRTLLVGHEGAVLRAVFAPDGRSVATAGADGTARLFDAESGELLRVFEHDGPLTSATFSADGEQLLTASEDRTARTWSVRDGTQLATYRHDRPVLGASFGPDSGQVLTWSGDGTARLWTGQTESAVFRHEGPVNNAIFSPDGLLVLTASEDTSPRVQGAPAGTARLFDARSGEELYVLEHERGVRTGAFSPDGALFVTSGREPTARIWETATGELVHELSDHDLPVTSASFTPSGAYVVTTSRDGAARVWDVATGVRHAIFLEHGGEVVGFGFSPDGEHVVTASSDRSVRIWETVNARSGPVLLGHSDTVTDAAFSPDGATVVTASLDGTARIWDASTDLTLEELSQPGTVTGMSISPDGRLMLVLTAESVQLLQTDTGQLVRSLERPGAVAAAFGPGGEVATAVEDGLVEIWDGESGTVTQTFEQEAAPTAAAFSSDGTLLAVSGADGTARIWNAETGESMQTLEAADAGVVTHVAVSPDARSVATAHEDGAARTWRVDDGSLLHELTGHAAEVTSVAFSTDGGRLVTASLDGDGRIWDTATGEPLGVLRGHSGPVSGAFFSPDGHWVVTAGPITAGLWDTETDRLVSYLRGHTKVLSGAAFTPDGIRIITSSTDGTVRDYTCDICGSIEALEALADARLERLGRMLTPDERAEFIEN